MALADVLVDYVERQDGTRRHVHLLPDAAGMRVSPVEVEPWPGDDVAVPAGEGRVLVDAWLDPWDSARVVALARRLGVHDVGVVLLRTQAADLPVGPVVGAFGGAGLRVVRVQPLTAGAARTLVAVTADPTVPVRTPVLGSVVDDDPAARARLANEWLLEGVQLRAALTRAEHELQTLGQALQTARDERDSVAASLRAAERELARIREHGLRARAHHLRVDAQRAAALVREDPAGGIRDVGRAVGRRLRPRG